MKSLLLIAAAVGPLLVPVLPTAAQNPAAPGGHAAAAPMLVSASDDDDSAPSLTVSGDFNHDGFADIAEVATSGLVISLGGPGGHYRQQGTGLPLGEKPRALVACDLDGDGNADLAVGDDDGTVLLFRGDGHGGFERAGAVANLGSVVSLVAADFNGDGLPDLAVSDWRSSKVEILAGDGHGGFRSEYGFPLRMAGTSPHLSTADFNGDGIADLAVVYDDDDGPSYDVMLGDGHGGFALSPKLSLIRDPNSHCVT
jgi:hypothetical protein